MLPSLGLDSESGKLFTMLAMGAGSMMISHANDAYFWVITKFSDIHADVTLRVSQQRLRSWALQFSYVCGSLHFSFYNPITIKEMDYKIIAEQIFLSGIESVLPDKLIRERVKVKDSTLFISTLQFPFNSINRIFVIGAGKASAMMAKEIENILGGRITEGHVAVKYSHTCELKYITVSEAGHPTPDNNGYLATQEILKIAEKATEKDLIICLVSGGGSALLADFPDGSTLNDMIIANDLLLKSGADIKEINAVRKHLSKVKGGQLAKAAYPASLVSLILSDVIGDPLDVIASGPTVPDSSTFEDAMFVLNKYRSDFEDSNAFG